MYWWAERYRGLMSRVTDCLTYVELDPSVYDGYAAFWIIYYLVMKLWGLVPLQNELRYLVSKHLMPLIFGSF